MRSLRLESLSVRTPVAVSNAVAILGFVGALVVDVADAVPVVVGVWAAVAVFEPIAVFGLARTQVTGRQDPVSVGVGA